MVATMRAPVAANGWPMAMLPPLTFSFVSSMGPERLVPPEFVAAKLVRLPGFQRCDGLRGERFVDFVEVEVLQPRLAAFSMSRDRVGRRHQQPSCADEVHRRHLAERR